MCANTKAFSSLTVDDVHGARLFYEKTLGWNVSEGHGDLTLHLAGGRDKFIDSKPDFTPATYTILNFAVESIDAAVEELSARGVRVERYGGTDQDKQAISRAEGGPLTAWFQDPAGNMPSLLEEA
jgi:predicted enzyme related to lactoylglutathione lyase